MFTRPNWKVEDSYQSLQSSECETLQIAWEFLRRNSDYCKDVLNFWCDRKGISPISVQVLQEKVYEEGLTFDSASEHAWKQFCANKWKINQAAFPDDDEGYFDFPIPTFDDEASFLPLDNGNFRGSRVLLPVDLADPVEATLSRIGDLVREMRERGIRSGAVVPKPYRVLSHTVYVQYLRILDAVEAQETYSDIGAILMPHAANDKESRQRDKRIRAAHMAAKKMQSEGYQGLLTETSHLRKI